MPQSFTTASREHVKERAAGNKNIDSVTECGDGLMVCYKRQSETRRAYTNLMEQTGWYVAAYEPSESGDVVTLMPVTEVR